STTKNLVLPVDIYRFIDVKERVYDSCGDSGVDTHKTAAPLMPRRAEWLLVIPPNRWGHRAERQRCFECTPRHESGDSRSVIMPAVSSPAGFAGDSRFKETYHAQTIRSVRGTL